MRLKGDCEHFAKNLKRVCLRVCDAIIFRSVRKPFEAFLFFFRCV